jgi:hypothetical protein
MPLTYNSGWVRDNITVNAAMLAGAWSRESLELMTRLGVTVPRTIDSGAR